VGGGEGEDKRRTGVYSCHSFVIHCTHVEKLNRNGVGFAERGEEKGGEV
jgi:hypothetical protein